MIKQTLTAASGGGGWEASCFLMYYLKWSVFNITFESSKEIRKYNWSIWVVNGDKNKNQFEVDEIIDYVKVSKHFNT